MVKQGMYQKYMPLKTLLRVLMVSCESYELTLPNILWRPKKLPDYRVAAILKTILTNCFYYRRFAFRR